MNPSVLTALLLGASLACGVIAYQRVSRYKMRWPRAAAIGIRIAFAIGVFASVWTVSTDVLWRFGVALRVGAINQDTMGESGWLGPACIAWSVLTYWELRRNSHLRSG
ncbi:MAG TPA: hypothetical protein VGM84_26860 [Steroidobacteraceae bacterium]|jgi:ABC-type Fe3+-siderophore transport system permease subunit